jgi:hypothetical protein
MCTILSVFNVGLLYAGSETHSKEGDEGAETAADGMRNEDEDDAEDDAAHVKDGRGEDPGQGGDKYEDKDEEEGDASRPSAASSWYRDARASLCASRA